MTEDKALCSTCFIWGKDRPALGNLCKNCNSYGLCERCAKKDVCLVCRQDLPNYDPAKDPRMGSNGKQKVWCATHGKKRGITNMDDNGDGSFYCKPECQCKDAGENPKGKGKEKGKESGKGKKKGRKTGPPHGKTPDHHADRRHRGNPPSDGDYPAKKRTRTDSNRSRGSNTSHASEVTNSEWPLTWSAKTPSTKPEMSTDRHRSQVAYEPSVIDGKRYSVLNHDIKGTQKTGNPPGSPSWI